MSHIIIEMPQPLLLVVNHEVIASCVVRIDTDHPPPCVDKTPIFLKNRALII